MQPRVILAFDPSTKGFSYGVIKAEGRQWRRLDSGTFHGSRREARTLVHTLHQTFGPDIWAVEDIAGFISAARAARQRSNNWNLQDLVDTAQWSGFLTGYAPDPDAVIFLPANNMGKRQSWRAYLTGNFRAGDHDVAHALNFHLAGGLPVKARTADGKVKAYAINEHQRDALGLAVAVGNLLTAPAGVKALKAREVSTK